MVKRENRGSKYFWDTTSKAGTLGVHDSPVTVVGMKAMGSGTSQKAKKRARTALLIHTYIKKCVLFVRLERPLCFKLLLDKKTPAVVVDCKDNRGKKKTPPLCKASVSRESVDLDVAVQIDGCTARMI